MMRYRPDPFQVRRLFRALIQEQREEARGLRSTGSEADKAHAEICEGRADTLDTMLQRWEDE